MIYLGKILGSETKIKILSVLVNNPRASYIEKELARESKSSVSEVNRQISDLVNAGVITMQRTGRIKNYAMNPKHFLFPTLQKLFIDLNKIYREVARKIKDVTVKKFKNIRTIILIGSLAQNKVREDMVKYPSDIDLILVVKKNGNIQEVKRFLLEYINTEISSKYGLTLYPFIISEKDYLKGLTRRNPFILGSYTKGEVIYGEKPRRFS